MKTNKLKLVLSILFFGLGLGRAQAKEMPEFQGIERWLNTEAVVSKEALKGKVVLVAFWTQSCGNCINTLPYLNQWREKYKDKGFEIVGVHTPEFKFESRIPNIERAIKKFGIAYPVAVDNAYETWNAYSNRYWPAHYFVDRKGMIRHQHFGEGDYAESEKQIQKLLAER